MTFANILKSTGIINNDSEPSVSHQMQSDVDRMIHGYHQNPYSSPNMFASNLYYPGAGYNLYNNHGFGLKYGPDYGGNEHSFSEYISDNGHGHSHSSENNHGHEIYHGGGGSSIPHYNSHVIEQPRYKTKSSSAMSALTLLAFLFFLNILQNCLKEHMASMNPTVMVMTAGVGRNSVPKLFDDLSFEGKELNTSLAEDNGSDRRVDHNEHGETTRKVKDFNETMVATPNTITFRTKF